MAEPHSLKVWDVVTHPSWPDGTKRICVGFQPFKRETVVKGRYRQYDDPKERVVQLDTAVNDGDSNELFWMEAGLVKVDG